jgi:SHS2 domain-containing protein
VYETFEHTADIGLRIRAGNLNELFADAGRALFSLIVSNLDAVRPIEEVNFDIRGQRYDDLMVDWLSALLLTFETRKLLFSQFDPVVAANGLKAAVRGEPLDPARHQLDMEVKAITYHGLKVEHDGREWQAEVIVDI